MDYSNHRCPVCEKAFEKDSDIVVCPDCGTPHHRECYEQEMHCHYQDRHNDGFDYKAEKQEEINNNTADPDSVECRYCSTINPTGSKFCNGCGMPLPQSGDGNTPYNRHEEEKSAPHGAQQGAPYQGQNSAPFVGFAFDPMGGIKSEEDMGGGVTAGEVAKFVKTSTPFYTRLFYQIRNFAKSRFSFVGFFFSGGWMLYRKMYKSGTLVTIIMGLLMLAQIYVETFHTSLLNEAVNLSSGLTFFQTAEAQTALNEFFAGLSTWEISVFGIYYFSTIGQFLIRLVCGIMGNKWYYKHCINKISGIKSKADTKEDADAQLQTKGGVNTALATSIAISYLLLSYLPYFI